jgi:glyoxylase-like metal-dependent hydrolase (beta-lactamase superfamily II)
MKVAAGVEMLEVSASLASGPGSLYPTLLWDAEEAVLADAGLPDMAQSFITAIANADVPLSKLRSIIITHHDIDHLGSLRDLQEALPNPAEIVAHTDEVPFIQGERPAIKLAPEMQAQMEEMMKGVPDGQRRAMQAMMESIGKMNLRVARTVRDGEELPCCGGIRIIHTPGHTPGHICLYHRASKTLIAGDALFVDGNTLTPAPSFINADTALALASIEKFCAFDIASVIAYHGGLFQNNPNQRLKEIAEGRI